MTRKRKTHTDKDLQFMERIYVRCAEYIPLGIKPHDNLYLLQDMMKTKPSFEISTDKNYKQLYEYAFLCGFYSAIQFHNEKITEQEHIKAFIKASRDKTKDHYNWFTENKGV